MTPAAAATTACRPPQAPPPPRAGGTEDITSPPPWAGLHHSLLHMMRGRRKEMALAHTLANNHHGGGGPECPPPPVHHAVSASRRGRYCPQLQGTPRTRRAGPSPSPSAAQLGRGARIDRGASTASDTGERTKRPTDRPGDYIAAPRHRRFGARSTRWTKDETHRAALDPRRLAIEHQCQPLVRLNNSGHDLPAHRIAGPVHPARG